MTRIDRSESQNIAEAQPEPLPQRIRFHRQLARADLYIPRLATTAPPVFTHKDGDRQSDPMSQIGMTVSWPLMAFVSYKVESGERIDTPAQPFPWWVGRASLRHFCLKGHYKHWQHPTWDGSLCTELVNITVLGPGDVPLERIYYDLEVAPSVGDDVLRKAFDHIDHKMKELHSKTTEKVSSDRGRNDWQAPTHVHQPLGGAHAEDCNNPVCVARRAA